MNERILNNQEYLKQEIKQIINKIQFLTNTPDDKIKKSVLLFTLRDLQKQLQVYL